MRISDWSSDVCSSELFKCLAGEPLRIAAGANLDREAQHRVEPLDLYGPRPPQCDAQRRVVAAELAAAEAQEQTDEGIDRFLCRLDPAGVANFEAIGLAFLFKAQIGSVGHEPEIPDHALERFAQRAACDQRIAECVKRGL